MQYGQKEFYQNVGANLKTEEFQMKHEFGTKATGYDAVGHMLQHLLNNVDPEFTHLKDPENDWEKKGEIIKFSQADFLPKKKVDKTGMQEFGYVYMPNNCKQK
jgi:hypothetical protein